MGFGYAQFQWAKALTTAVDHQDAETRSRAEARAARWMRVLEHVARGTANYGSRTPFAGVPAWATLEVATGGFATGALLAGGELTEHERALAKTLPQVRVGDERLDLNRWHLTDAGLEHLQRMLAEGRYRIDVPEEAALPFVAWLMGHGREKQALTILEAIAPFFDQLRFFPAPTDRPMPLSAEVCVFSAGDVRQRLARRGEHAKLALQRHAVAVRLPLYDETISLFLQTYVDGWPCRHYPAAWNVSASELSMRIANNRRASPSGECGPEDRKRELFELLSVCAKDPASLSGRQVGRIRRIVDDFVRAHGAPGSAEHQALRLRQQRDVAGAAHHRIGHAVAERLADYPAAEGIADFTTLVAPISDREAEAFAITAGEALPPSIRRRVERCRRGTIAELIEHGIVTSGDTIAILLPALTAEIGSSELADPVLRRLYAATYRAFRRRRSLLLLNLQSQVRLTELPWVAAVENDRSRDASTVEAARAALIESATVAITAFPHAITPNKLVREFRALAKSAELSLPFVDEIAADIFMGEFTNTFVDAARRAAPLIAGRLYARYYDIDTDVLAALPDRPKPGDSDRRWWKNRRDVDELSALAAKRAGVVFGRWSVADNGRILEQSQILTTHNLALLFQGVGLHAVLDPTLDAIALRCFEWICKRQQMRIRHWHAQLIMLKNTAYAWRQMIFYLSMLDDARMQQTIARIGAHFHAQSEAFKTRFEPAMRGLRAAAQGRRLSLREPDADGGRVFLGWTSGRHWLSS